MDESEQGYGGADNSVYNLMVSPPADHDECIDPTFAIRFTYDSFDKMPMPLSSLTQYIYPFMSETGESVAYPVEPLSIRKGGVLKPFNPFPGYQPFSYQLSDVGMPYGETSAILCLPVGYYHDPWDGFTRIDFSPKYLGQLGEHRVAILSKQTLTINGEEQILPQDNLSLWSEMCEEAPVGDVKLTLVNSNLVQGTNTAAITFNTTRSDNCPPSPTMMMCKNKDGIITNTFKESSDGEMYLSATDLVCHMIPQEDWIYAKYWFEPSVPHIVEISYAPHTEGTFIPLPIEELSEYFTFYGFGALYHAELQSISVESPTGWYDLRIYLEDECGNSHEQTIEGAFCIETLSSGVNSLHNIDSEDSLRIFTLDGREISNSCHIHHLTDLPTGLYIFKTANHAEKVMIP